MPLVNSRFFPLALLEQRFIKGFPSNSVESLNISLTARIIRVIVDKPGIPHAIDHLEYVIEVLFLQMARYRKKRSILWKNTERRVVSVFLL